MIYKSLRQSLCSKGNYTEAIFANFGRGTFEIFDKDGRKQEINGFILKKESQKWHVEKDKYVYVLDEYSLLEFDDYYKNEDGRFVKKQESIYQSYITQEKLASNIRNMEKKLKGNNSLTKKERDKFKKYLIENEMLIKASGEALLSKPVTKKTFFKRGGFRRKEKKTRKKKKKQEKIKKTIKKEKKQSNQRQMNEKNKEATKVGNKNLL